MKTKFEPSFWFEGLNCVTETNSRSHRATLRMNKPQSLCLWELGDFTLELTTEWASNTVINQSPVCIVIQEDIEICLKHLLEETEH